MINEILDGIYEAHKLQWKCGGKTPFKAVESVYQRKIADSIYKAGFKYIEYEYKVKDLMRELGITSGVSREGGNIDLVIKDNNKRPLAIIEVKSEFSHSHPTEEDDVIRICELLKPSSRKFQSLFGVFVFCLARHKEANPKNYIEENFYAVENNTVKPVALERGCTYTCHKRKIEDKINIVWGGRCYEIRA